MPHTRAIVVIRIGRSRSRLAWMMASQRFFEPGNVPQYLSVVAGNLKKVRLQDVIFPQSIIRAHKGPRFGIEDA